MGLSFELRRRKIDVGFSGFSFFSRGEKLRGSSLRKIKKKSRFLALVIERNKFFGMNEMAINHRCESFT